MQPGSVGSSASGINAWQQQQQVQQQKAAGEAAAPPEEAVADVSSPEDLLTLAARFKVHPDALAAKDTGEGQMKSEMTIALVPEKDKAALESQGVVFPEIEEVRSDAGMQPGGRLDLVPVDATGNPKTTHILQTLEVDKSLLEANAEGQRPIDDYYAQLIPNGSTVLPEGFFGVPDGTVVAPAGYEFQMGTSEAGAKTEAKRLRLNRLSNGVGNFSQSSMAGIMRIPYFSSAAPLLGLVTAGPAMNLHYSSLKEAQDTLGYVENREKLSKTDKISLELGVGAEFEVSARAEKKRLETKVRDAKSKMLSTTLGAAAGGASVLGYAAAGGMFGSGTVAAALTGAVAATPYLAGAAMIVGSAGMVVNSLAELKSLSQEKAELQALLDKGETHKMMTIERVSPELKRPIAVGEQMVPIEERLKSIQKDQRKHRLLATAISGGMASVAGTVALGTSALAVAPLALVPAGAVAAGQSIAKLKELSAEKKELNELHQTGATMAPRQVERQDGSWKEEKIPISTLLSEIEKKQKTNKLILTAVGSAGAMMGLTLGAGLSAIAAAPVLLLPAIVGAALFPDKVKAFAEKVAGFITNRFSADGRERKELMKEAQEQTEATKQKLIADLDPLAQQDPSLFYVPSKAELKAAKASGQPPQMGYFTQLNSLMDQYAEAGSRVGRFQAMQQMEALLAQAPPNAQAYIGKVREQLSELHMNTEAGWVARDVALELKKESTGKMLEDDRVKARLSELGYGAENLREQLEQSLFLENDEKKLQATLQKSRAGDRDASLELARKEVFAAGRTVYQIQEELGTQLSARLIDALAQPENADNLELLIKEVNYKLGRPMAPSTEGGSEKWWLDESTISQQSGFQEPLRLADFTGLTNAVAVLEKPLDLNAASAPVEKPSTVLEGPQARMASAFRQLHSVDSEAAGRLGKAFATLNDPAVYEGLSAEQVQQKRAEAGLELTKAKAELSEKAPDLVGLWDKARVDVEEEYFQRSIDHDFAESVLARPEVAEASERLGVTAEQAKALYMGYLRSEVTGDVSALQNQLVASSGKEVDPAKAELLSVLDRSMATVAAEKTGGGNDTVASQGELGKPETDPAIATFLQSNPAVAQVLESEQLVALASELGVTPETVREAYLTLVQANINPVMAAEFDGLVSGGDVKAAQTFQMGSRVGQLVQAALTPAPELVAQQVEAGMAGPVVNAVLNHPEIKALAEKLQVQTEPLMRTLLAADLAGDKAPLEALAQKAQSGDAGAAAQLQMIQTLAQATLQISAELQQAQQQQPDLPTAA